MSNGAEDLPPTRRLAALKMVKVMLKYVQRPGGVSKELETQAREWMQEVVKWLRAETAMVEEVACICHPLDTGLGDRLWLRRRSQRWKAVILG